MIHTHTFDNGLVLLAEPMPWLESAAFSFLIPLGAAYDPPDRAGLGAMTCEMALRGCGDRDSRQFIDDLESLGVERAESVSVSHTSYGGATLSENLPSALQIYADLMLRPHMPADQLEAGRQVAIQELRSIEDEPSHKVMVELKRRFYPEPWGRSSQGSLAGLEATAIDDVREHFAAGYRPEGTIISVAGRIEWQRLKDDIGALLGDWSVSALPVPKEGDRGPRVEHLDHESNQTQIGIAYDSVPYRDEDYFQAWGAVGVLSGGSSSRLFTEVREKRGLCYSVGASCSTLRDRGCVMCYAGTSAERAQETLDVTLSELVRLAGGVEAHELDRLKARIKSNLIMQQESSAARSGSIARDWYHLGKVRTMEEISALVDDLSCQSINAYLSAHPPGDFTVVTLGQSPLEVAVEVS